MSGTNGQPRSRPQYNKRYPPQPGDQEQGEWSHENLEEMNARFIARMERAFETGQESRASAAREVKLPANSVPRMSTPLTREVQDGLWRSSA
jgi:hypothetical protein